MVLFHLHDEKIVPIQEMWKIFDKPVVLTDASTIPRQTHYACPYCMSKIDIVTENLKVVGVKPAHFSGLLNALPPDAPLPDECLICPKVLQCNIRKK